MTTAAHTTDSLALLEAIRAHPGEDTPRLMYADAIEEIDPARAELIRLQCRPKCYPCECVQGIVKMQYDCPTCIAASRERDLLKANEVRWRAGKRTVCPDCVHWKGRVPWDCRCGGTRRIDAGGLLEGFDYKEFDDPPSDYGQEEVRLTWDRGFITRVTVPRLTDLVEERGDSAMGWRLVPTDFSRSVLNPEHGPERALISELVPLDREPYWNGKAYAWFRRGRPRASGTVPESAELPASLFDAIEQADTEVLGRLKGEATRDLAISALGRAIAEFCRTRS